VNGKARKGHSIYKVGSRASGNILVKITPEEWERLAQYKGLGEQTWRDRLIDETGVYNSKFEVV